MIVPASRLLFWTSLVVLPFSLLAAVVPATATVSFCFIAGLIMLATLDALRARAVLSGIGVELPPVVRMSRDREARLEVRIRNEQRRGRHLRLGLPWPAEIRPGTDEMEVALPADSEWSRLVWPCTPLRRGRYRFERAYLEGASPLGFWSFRKSLPLSSEVRIYPNLLKERKNLAALFLNRGRFGVHARRQVGKGREFEKLREYVPGDGYDEIHWKATARRGKPITKVFQIERTQEVYVIVDASRLSARPAEGRGGTESILERLVTATLVLGRAAEQQGDLFGLIAATDRVEKFVRAKNGRAHYHACRDALYLLQPKPVTPDYDELCSFIRLRLRRRALLVFLTSLDDPAVAESFVRNLDMIRRQHLVLVNMLQPPGVAPLFGNAAVGQVDDLYRELGGHLRWKKLQELQRVLQRRGVQFSLLANERLSAELVAQYLNV
ncbi:MAG TPA: DUF58 domain-containing protein, partial [Verrucomicrobiae bacterium]|nr:DUF58 domain-containing protein [Verrucomicrobiae bacterium]